MRAGTNSAATTRPPVASKPFRKPRRLTFSMVAWTDVMSRSRGSRLDGGGDALVAAAAADVAAHGIVDLRLGGVFVRPQERRGLHDLAGLAIAALRDIQGAPCLLYRMVPLRIQPLDGRNRTPGRIADRGDARPGGLAIDMDRAGATQRHAATKFRSGEPQFVAQIPQQGHR